MEKEKVNPVWKTIAIIFIILFLAETSIFFIGYIQITKEETRTNKCYYDICSKYPEAIYENNVCYCYDYGVLGEFVVAKTEHM